ncbi:MAG: fasciclin domain-containing protein, partial [Bosea sp. (in: a-proteobacteria)]|uniref:fasciclin domain-containing protein n=1 Tax=Bosea sp. (in: a-proteobacteria) TaxID=1871050 RepID=UPI003F7B799F
DMLLKPDQKAKLTAVLTYHVVPGNLTSAQLMADAKAGGSKAMLKTVQGETLKVAMAGGKLEIIDAKGGKSMVTIPDVKQSNGVIHVVDTVLMPK